MFIWELVPPIPGDSLKEDALSVTYYLHMVGCVVQNGPWKERRKAAAQKRSRFTANMDPRGRHKTNSGQQTVARLASGLKTAQT